MTDHVSANTEKSRFEITSDNDLAGFAQYVDAGNQRIFFHTEIDDAYSGRGLASVLVQQALDDTIAAGLRIVPVCPYVAKFIEGHETYQSHSDKVTPEAIAAARNSG